MLAQGGANTLARGGVDTELLARMNDLKLLLLMKDELLDLEQLTTMDNSKLLMKNTNDG